VYEKKGEGEKILKERRFFERIKERRF